MSAWPSSSRRLFATASTKIPSSMDASIFTEPIHVLGSGSIGLLFASSIRMAFPSYPLRLLLRPHHKRRLQPSKEVQVSVFSTGGRPRMVSIPAEIIDSSNKKPIRNLLVCTKAPDAAIAVQSVVDRLKQHDARVIILSNGALALREELKQLLQDFNEIKLVLASTTHGAYREEEGNDDDMMHVVHAGIGKTLVETEPALAKMLDRAGLVATSVSAEEANVNMWHKLAANCVINPITALLNIENGGLRDVDQEYQTLQKDVVNEVSEVGMATIGSNIVPELEYEPLQDFVNQVIQDTAQNKSSMLQDVLRRRSTEIQYLNGHVVRCGQKLGLETPANALLCERVERLTENFLTHKTKVT